MKKVYVVISRDGETIGAFTSKRLAKKYGYEYKAKSVEVWEGYHFLGNFYLETV